MSSTKFNNYFIEKLQTTAQLKQLQNYTSNKKCAAPVLEPFVKFTMLSANVVYFNNKMYPLLSDLKKKTHLDRLLYSYKDKLTDELVKIITKDFDNQ